MWRLPAVDVVRELREGRVTPLALIDEVEARLAKVDRQVNAVPIRCLERARERARLLEERGHPQDPLPGYLYGLPVLVKDDKAVEGVLFVHGTPIYRDAVAPMSDASVLALEASGGIVVGKTNLPEFAAGANTYNPVFGETLNPWDLAKTSGGSSGGSAAALAVGIGWLATGSDLGGSLRIPASFCGVVGLRCTASLVPREPPFPARRGPKPGPPPGPVLEGVTGPMGRCVADVALLLEAQSPPGREGRAPPGAYVRAAERGAAGDWGGGGAGGAPVVAWSPDLGGLPVEPEVVRITEAAARWFATQGAEVVTACPGSFRGAGEIFQTLRAHKMCALGDMLSFKRDQLKPEIVWNVEKGLSQTEAEVEAAYRAHDALVRDVGEFFRGHALLCAPVACAPPFDVKTRWLTEVAGVEQHNYVEWLYTCAVVTLSNCPAISVPCGLTADGLPVGLQIVAPPGQDAALLQAAAAFEAAHGFAAQVPRDPGP